MAAIVESIRGEFARYRGLAEAAIAQLTDADLGGSRRRIQQLHRDDLLARVRQPAIAVHRFPDRRR
jgi:hypothetical protein